MDIKDTRVWLNPQLSYKMLLWLVVVMELLATMEVLQRQDSLIKSSWYPKIQTEVKLCKVNVNKIIVEILVVVESNNVARLSFSKITHTDNQTNSHPIVKVRMMNIKKFKFKKLVIEMFKMITLQEKPKTNSLPSESHLLWLKLIRTHNLKRLSKWFRCKSSYFNKGNLLRIKKMRLGWSGHSSRMTSDLKL
jgi:hypothetical protein